MFNELVIQGFALQWIEPSYDIDRGSSIDIPGEDNDGFIEIDSFSGKDDPDNVSKVVVSKKKIDTSKVKYSCPSCKLSFCRLYSLPSRIRKYGISHP